MRDGSPMGSCLKSISSFTMEPNTPYFLVVGCTASVSVARTSFASGLTGVLFGVADFATVPNSNIISTSWVYVTAGLPATFGPPTYSTGGAGVPNVYVGP
jgi:hypothetical protein